MKIKDLLLKTVLPTVLLTGTVLLAVAPISCKVSEEGIQLLTGDFSVPHIESMDVPDGKTVTLYFDKSVRSATASLSESTSLSEPAAFEHQNMTIAPVTITYQNENKTILFSLAEETSVGALYTLTGTVTDNSGNTLTFSIPFTGYNTHVPQLVLSEVRNAYSTTTDKTTGTKKYKCEFIELYALTAGNLAGIELLNASDGEEKKFLFPSVEVAAGEYIVVHLRKMEAGCIDETGTDLTLSTATDSCPTARDFWADNTKARLASSDIIMVRNSNSGALLDVLLFANSSLSAWDTSYATYISAIEASGIWVDGTGESSCAPSSAVVSDAITSSAATRTLSRKDVPLLPATSSAENSSLITNAAQQWIITANKGSGTKALPGATPGYANSTNAYEAKQ